MKLKRNHYLKKAMKYRLHKLHFLEIKKMKTIFSDPRHIIILAS